MEAHLWQDQIQKQLLHLAKYFILLTMLIPREAEPLMISANKSRDWLLLSLLVLNWIRITETMFLSFATEKEIP